jgi:hypothetical protein
MRDCGVQVGLGTHIPEVVCYAEERGWDIDFYMTCLYNLSRRRRESALVSGAHQFSEEQYLAEDREKMAEVIRQTPKTCLAFKILAAGRNCRTQADVQQAFQFAFDNIKKEDAVVVGVFAKYQDQVSLNVQYTLDAIQASGSPEVPGSRAQQVHERG